MNHHRVVPVSKDLHEPDGPTRWRCASCGKTAPWPGSIQFDGPCEQPSLFEDDES